MVAKLPSAVLTRYPCRGAKAAKRAKFKAGSVCKSDDVVETGRLKFHIFCAGSVVVRQCMELSAAEKSQLSARVTDDRRLKNRGYVTLSRLAEWISK